MDTSPERALGHSKERSHSRAQRRPRGRGGSRSGVSIEGPVRHDRRGRGGGRARPPVPGRRRPRAPAPGSRRPARSPSSTTVRAVARRRSGSSSPPTMGRWARPTTSPRSVATSPSDPVLPHVESDHERRVRGEFVAPGGSSPPVVTGGPGVVELTDPPAVGEGVAGVQHGGAGVAGPVNGPQLAVKAPWSKA